MPFGPPPCSANLAAASWRLPEEDFQALSTLRTQCRQARGVATVQLPCALACQLALRVLAARAAFTRIRHSRYGTDVSRCRRMLDGAWCVSPDGPYRSLEELWDTPHEERTSGV